MAKYELKQKAIKLRKLGKSYNQIKRELKVSKGSLSLWLREHPLTKKQMQKVRDFSEVRIEKFRETMLRKRTSRFDILLQEEANTHLPLSERELFIAGLFLYWGEGLKDLKYPLAIYNTNPHMVKFAMLWYTKILGIPVEKIKIKLHLYSDMSVQTETNFWSKKLNISKAYFSKPYIKKNPQTNITYRGSFGHGTCGIIVNDVRLKERVIAALTAISNYYEN